MSEIISKSDYEFVSAAIEKILTDSVEHIELTDGIPPLSSVTDSNKVFKGKLSILFVDMRKSSELTDELKSKKMVKIYRSFIRLIIQAIRYSGGVSRQFAGDGIMGVFQDSIDNETNVLGAQKALRAARYIITLIDYCLNPLLSKHMSEINISCGIGICTGTIMITKAGMRGKESDENSEDELGIVWVGSTTNNASRYCSLAKGGEIFIDPNTHKEANDDSVAWEKCSRIKGTRKFEGYLASDYYLQIDENIEVNAVKATIEKNIDKTFINDIFDQTAKESLALVEEIAKMSAELALKISELEKREEQIIANESSNSDKEVKLYQLQNELNDKQKAVEDKANKNKIDEYELNRSIFAETFCKKTLITQLGKSYWTNLISKMISLGELIGKNDISVKSDLAHYLVDIYQCFAMHEEAYDALCIQAEYGDWIHTNTVEDVVMKSKHWYRLKMIIENRKKPGHDNTLNDYINVLNKLKSMGY